MEVNVIKSSEAALAAGETCLIIPLFEKQFPLNSDLLGNADELFLQAIADKEIFTGKAKECYFLPAPEGRNYTGVLVLGLGKQEGFEAEVLRRAAGEACDVFRRNRITHACLDVSHFGELPAEAFIEGVILGQYDFDVYKEKDQTETQPVKLSSLTVAISGDADQAAVEERCKLAAIICLSANGARHLANTAPNEMTPATLAEFAKGVAKDPNCVCSVLEPEEMETLGMNALLGVGRGSSNPPRLILLHYRHPEAKKTLAMVGKGITFDAGGISLKPAAAMHEMKYDMCGAAAVLCAMMNVVELKPKVDVIAVVPAAENKTGSDAQRPGDIVKAYNGKTIEVLNTDAEGRLILADALSFTIDKYKPDAIVDIATLTGAVVVALGHYAAGLFSTAGDLAGAITQASEVTGERVWQFPIWEDYEKLMEGTHADLANIGPKGEAGSILAAVFLKQFTAETPWAHIDIAGTAWGGKNISYLDPDHATGYGVRLLTHWILGQQER